MGFLRTRTGKDTIWVVVDRLTKSVHFLPMKLTASMEELVRQYVNEIVTVSIDSDKDSRFISRFCKSFNEAMGTTLSLSTAYHPQTDGQLEIMI